MASVLMVPVCRIKNLREHPNAALLGLADILGYQMVVPLVEDANGPFKRCFVAGKRDENGKRIPCEAVPPNGEADTTQIEWVNFNFKYRENQLVVYFPADVLIPAEWADKFGVRAFLKGQNQDRVGKIKLRGEPSFGLVVDLPENVDWTEGDNVAEFYGATKYEPPLRASCGDSAKYDGEIDPHFEKFTDVQNGRIFVDVLKDGEEVIFTEKIHGTNCRLGFINGVAVAGSMTLRRKRPVKKDGEVEIDCAFADPEMKASTYWFPWTIPAVHDMLHAIKDRGNLLLCGEVYGGSIQSLAYGVQKGKGLGFRAFGLRVNGKFMDWDEFETLCKQYGVETVPVVYRGPFSMALAKTHADGKTTMTNDGQIREGIVAYPVKERDDPKVGRAILKYIGTEYELSKHKERDTTDA